MHDEEGVQPVADLDAQPEAHKALSPELLAAAQAAGRAEARMILHALADDLQTLLDLQALEPRAQAPGPGVVLCALRRAAERLEA